MADRKRFTLRLDEETYEQVLITTADMMQATKLPISIHTCILNLLDIALDKYWKSKEGDNQNVLPIM